MDYQVTYFCELLKNVIHSEQESQLNGDVNWSQLVKMAKEHNLLPIFLEGAIKYPSYTRRSDYEKELDVALAIVGAQVRRTNAFLKLYEAFLKADLHPIVMKGVICRCLYGNLADHRPSGDEDILIRPEEYWKAKKVLLANGYRTDLEFETEAQLKQIQEVTFSHPTEKLCIELHLNPMGRDTDVRSRMSDCFCNVFENYREVEVNGVCVRTMNHQDHYLFLILHAFRHFTAGGLGIRQMLDILLYQEYYGGGIDLQNIYEQLQVFHAESFFADMIHIGNTYLGFALSVMREPNCPQELMEDMIRCGTFGNKTQAERTAIATTMAATENHAQKRSTSSGVLIWRSIFPSYAFMRERYPYLEEKPWLLPYEWIKRWGRFLVHNQKNDGKLAMESLQISQRRMKLLKKYDLV